MDPTIARPPAIALVSEPPAAPSARMEVPARNPAASEPAPAPDSGFNWPILAVLVAVVAAVAVSNVWLRLRAEHRSTRDLLRHWRRELWPFARGDRE